MSRTKLGFVILLSAMVVAIGFWALGELWARNSGEEPIVGALVWTGRLAFVVFLIPLFARPLRQLMQTNWTAWLMRHRRNAGVAYGGIQLVHLVAIAQMFRTLESPPTEAVMVAVGALGIVLAVGMLVTSFETTTRWLGPKLWRALHRAGFHVFMFIYFYDFVLDPLLIGTMDDYWPFATVVLLGMTVRTIVLFKPRGATARPAS